MFTTRKTHGATTFEVRRTGTSPIDGPYDVVARGLNHEEALFLTETLNHKGWTLLQAYDTVYALVDADCLHEALYLAMHASDAIYRTQAA